MVTPTANTSTPSQGAQEPSNASELENARSADTPTIPMPATIPKARSPSWVPPQTSRLDPATICPSVSSRKAVVSATPGMKTTSEAIIARRPGSVTSYFTASATIAATQVAARNGMSASTVRRPRPSRRRAPTSAPSTAAHATSRAAGWRISAIPTVSTAYPSTLDTSPNRLSIRRIASSRSMPTVGATSPRSAWPASSWTARDLIEAGRPGEPRRGLDRRRLPLAEREQDECREGAEPGVAQPVRPRDHAQPRLDGVDGLADRAQRRAERRKEQQDVVVGSLCDVLDSRHAMCRRAPAPTPVRPVWQVRCRRRAALRAPASRRGRGRPPGAAIADDRGERLRSVAQRVDGEEGEHDQRSPRGRGGPPAHSPRSRALSRNAAEPDQEEDHQGAGAADRGDRGEVDDVRDHEHEPPR